MVSSDNTPGGYGGLDVSQLVNVMVWILLVVIVLMMVYLYIRSIQFNNLKEDVQELQEKIKEIENKKEV